LRQRSTNDLDPCDLEFDVITDEVNTNSCRAVTGRPNGTEAI